MKKYNYVRFCIFFIIFFSAASAHAATMSISEIQYDVPGTDTGREWIEVQNTSAGSILASKLVLIQGGSKHAVTSYQGDEIQPGAYAVISPAPDKFKGTIYNVTLAI